MKLLIQGLVVSIIIAIIIIFLSSVLGKTPAENYFMRAEGGGASDNNQKLMVVNQATGAISFVDGSLQNINNEFASNNTTILNGMKLILGARLKGDCTEGTALTAAETEALMVQDTDADKGLLCRHEAGHYDEEGEHNGIAGHIIQANGNTLPGNTIQDEVYNIRRHIRNYMIHQGDRVYIDSKVHGEDYRLMDGGCDGTAVDGEGNQAASDNATWCRHDNLGGSTHHTIQNTATESERYSGGGPEWRHTTPANP